MDELLRKYKEYGNLLKMYSHAVYILGFDTRTDCPKLGREKSNEVESFFQKKILDIVLSKDYIDTVFALFKIKDQLNEVDRLDIEFTYEDLEKDTRIPKDQLEKQIDLIKASELAWDNGKHNGDFSEFEKHLNDYVSFCKDYCHYIEEPEIKGYDVLLNKMEKGYNEKMYDAFFNKLEKELLPFVHKVLKAPKPYNPKLDTLRFPLDKQRELTRIIANKMGYTADVGCIRETTHPFTNWSSNKDVRVTTSYDEGLLFSNVYSIIHEIGHALFQLQMDDKYNDTATFNKVTCITHESQSRFYENYLGRDKAFVSFLYPTLTELFPTQMEGITEDDVYNYVNAVNPENTIRCEADELTYPFHILMRYKVEKGLFHNELEVKDIERYFNSLMKEYLLIEPKDKANGCFQDIHWTSDFGYFPTYAVGSAYGAMFIKELEKKVDYKADLAKGDFTRINAWLKENIHQYSATRKNDEVIRAVCGRDFSADEYIAYLKDKFGKIYNIK